MSSPTAGRLIILNATHSKAERLTVVEHAGTATVEVQEPRTGSTAVIRTGPIVAAGTDKARTQRSGPGGAIARHG